MTKYRIGIDVGGTFTHAVAINNDDYTVSGQSKVPTTHRSLNGVADGIIQSLRELLTQNNISPSDVVFIAHSTTQATNAMLEGDVAVVGVILCGQGVEGARAVGETDLKQVNIGEGKFVKVLHRYIAGTEHGKIFQAITSLKRDGAGAIVAAEAFSVDDPANEDKIVSVCGETGMPAIATHEISGLYGLKMRTRTAVINASIMPKMLETAEATNRCVIDSGITAPLMIMRSDGGVMSIDQMKKRPILTILSGPAAGVASALLYVKISDGIFLEVGGTSTDIAVIKNGKAIVRTAEIGGKKLYLRTLDSRTVGVAGGSLPRMTGGRITDVGPRSAHIAGLKYSAFSRPDEIASLNPEFISPVKGDPSDYVSLGRTIAVTTTCASNILGLAKHGDYAFGNADTANTAMDKLKSAYKDNSETATALLKTAVKKVLPVIQQLIKDYKLEKDSITLVGGGGGAAAIVPFTAGEMGLPFRIAENHAVISAIGAALAMVTDTIERSVIDPKSEDILKIRREAEDSVRKMGAAAETIEITVEVDRIKNIVRACARGSTEMKKRDMLTQGADPEKRKTTVAGSLKTNPDVLKLGGSTDWFEAWTADKQSRGLFGLIKTTKSPVRVIDREGVIKLSRPNAKVYSSTAADSATVLKKAIDENSRYGDGGERIPPVFVLCKSKILDLSGVIMAEQALSLFAEEQKSFASDDSVVIIVDTE